jgi:hypothetical protein
MPAGLAGLLCLDAGSLDFTPGGMAFDAVLSDV